MLQLWKEGEPMKPCFLDSEKDIKEKKETLLFSLCFLLVTGVKVISSASGTSIAISTLGRMLE